MQRRLPCSQRSAKQVVFHILVSYDRIAFIRVFAPSLSDKLAADYIHRAWSLKLTGNIGRNGRPRASLFLLNRKITRSRIAALFDPKGTLGSRRSSPFLPLSSRFSGALLAGTSRSLSSKLSRKTTISRDFSKASAKLGRADLTNRKLTIKLLLRQFDLILASLPLLLADLTKLLTVGLNRRQSAFTNRANEAWIARPGDAKPGFDQRHVHSLIAAGSRVNALLLHPFAQSADTVRK